jgi:hypothetical protein
MATIESAIRGGQFDQKLDRIIEAVKFRRRVLGHLQFLEFKEGDILAFNDTVNPTYLRGEKVTLISKRRNRVLVQLHSPVGKFRSGRIVVNPALLQKSS